MWDPLLWVDVFVIYFCCCCITSECVCPYTPVWRRWCAWHVFTSVCLLSGVRGECRLTVLVYHSPSRSSSWTWTWCFSVGSQLASVNLLSPPPQCWSFRCRWDHPWFPIRICNAKITLQGCSANSHKHWAISPALIQQFPTSLCDHTQLNVCLVLRVHLSVFLDAFEANYFSARVLLCFIIRTGRFYGLPSHI